MCRLRQSKKTRKQGCSLWMKWEGAEIFKYLLVTVPLVDIGPKVACFEVEQNTWKGKWMLSVCNEDNSPKLIERRLVFTRCKKDQANSD